MWSEILVLFCSAVSIILLFSSKNSRFHQISIFTAAALCCVVLGFIPSSFNPVSSSLMTEWAKITGITSALIVLATIVRHFKPLYARFPQSFCFTPVVIILFYPFITDATVLKDLLNQILQGGALLIALLLAMTMRNKLDGFFILMAGIFLLFFAYGLYWIDNEWTSASPWLWQLLLAGGVISVSKSIFDIMGVMNEQSELT